MIAAALSPIDVATTAVTTSQSITQTAAPSIAAPIELRTIRGIRITRFNCD